jgi:HK97 family phage portal protein
MRWKIPSFRFGFGRKEHSGPWTFDQVAGWLSGFGGRTGANINYEIALQVGAVLACVRVVAEDIGKLPFKVYQTDKDDPRRRTLARDHHLYKILSRKPNNWMTSQEFREAMTASFELTGNAYAIKWWSDLDKTTIKELIPVLPGMVETKQRADYHPYYLITMADGGKKEFAAEDVFHIRGVCLNGFLKGTSILQKAAEVMGFALTSEDYISNLLKKGATPPGILSTDVNLTTEQVEEMRKMWKEKYSGWENAGETPVLYNGMKYNAVGQSSKDSQQVENDDRNVLKICGFFRVHPNKIFAFFGNNPATYASAAQFAVDHVNDTIKPRAQRWMNSADNRLLTDEEVDEQGYYTKIPLLALLDGDPVQRATYYKTMRELAAMDVNQIRALEEYELYEDAKFNDATLPLNTNPLPAGAQKPAEDDQNAA